MKYRSLAAAISAALTLVAGTASAQQTSVGLIAGTPGLGLDLGQDVSDTFGLRASGNWFSLSKNVESDGVNYDGKLKLLSLGVLADVYPFDAGFRLTAGAAYNDNHFNLTATPTGTVTIGGTSYTPAQVGSLNGGIEFNDFSPYAGLGYTSNRGGRGLAFVFDAGVMFQGRPEVSLVSTGPISTTPGFQADLERERRQIADDIKIFRYYPVIRLGAAYRF